MAQEYIKVDETYERKYELKWNSTWPKHLGSVNYLTSFLHFPSLPPFPRYLSHFLSFIICYHVDRLQKHPPVFEISFPKGKTAVWEDNIRNDSCESDSLLWDRLNYALGRHRLNVTISRTFSLVFFKIRIDMDFKVSPLFHPFLPSC